MPGYLIQLTYHYDVLAGFVKHPTDRGEVIRKLAAKMGGTDGRGELVSLWRL